MSTALAWPLLLAVKVGIFPADAPSSRALTSALRRTGIFEVVLVRALSNPVDLEGLGVLVLAPRARLDDSGLVAVDAFLQAGGGVLALGEAGAFLPPFTIDGRAVWGKRMIVNLTGKERVAFSHPDPFHFALLPSPLSSPVSVDEMGRVTGAFFEAGRGKFVALGDPLSSGMPTGGQFRALIKVLRCISPRLPIRPTSAYLPLAVARARLFRSLLKALDRARSVEWSRCPALDRIARAAGKVEGGEALREEALRLKASLRGRVEEVCRLASKEAWGAIRRLYEEEGVEFLPEVESKCEEIASLPEAMLKGVKGQVEASLPFLERRLKALQRGFAGLLPVRRPRGWERRCFPFVLLSGRPASEALVEACSSAGAVAASPRWSVRLADRAERAHVLWLTMARSPSPEAVRGALPSHLLSRNSLAGAVIEGFTLPGRASPERLALLLAPILQNLGIRTDAEALAREALSKGEAPSFLHLLARMELEKLRRSELLQSLATCFRAVRMRRDDLIVCPVVRGTEVGAFLSAGSAPWAILDPQCGGASAAFLLSLLGSAGKGRALLCVDAGRISSPSMLSKFLFLSLAFADGPALRPFELVSPYKPPGIFPAPGATPPSWRGNAWSGVEEFWKRAEAVWGSLLRSSPAEEVGLVVSLRALDLSRALGEEAQSQYIPNLAGWFELLQKAGLPSRPVFAEALDREVLSKFRALIVPDGRALPFGFEEELRRFVREGGALIATADTSLYDPFGRRRPNYGLSDLFGVRRKHEAHGASSIILAKEAALALGAETRRASVDPGRRYVVVAPATKRVWAKFSSGHPAVVVRSVGRGICVFIAYPKLGLCYDGAPLRGNRLDPARSFRRGLVELIRSTVEGAMGRAGTGGGPTFVVRGVSPHLLFSLRSLGRDKFLLHLVNLCSLRPVEGIRVRVMGKAVASYLLDGSKVETRQVGQFTWLAVRPVRDYECLVIERRA